MTIKVTAPENTFQVYPESDPVIGITDNQHLQEIAENLGYSGDLVGLTNNQLLSIIANYMSTEGILAAAPVQSVNGLTGAVVLAEEVQQYANLAAFPATGAAGAIYIAQDTGKLYRWVSAGVYAELAPSPDEVQQYANLAAFPATGEAAALYIAADTGLVYRWNGAAYVGLNSSSSEIEVYGSLAAFPYTGVVGRLYIATDTGVAYTWSASGSNYVTTAVSGAVTQVDSLDGGTVFVNKTADVIVSTRFSGHATKQLQFSADITDDPTTDGIYFYAAYSGINFLSVTAASGVKTAYVSGSPVTAIPENTIVTVTKTTWFDSVSYQVKVPALGVHLLQSRSIAAPNASVPVHAQTAVGLETAIDAALVPKGNGALLASVPNNSSTGGNKRGVRAVDWQTERTAATQVASGINSVISGGKSNATAAGAAYSVVAGGDSNSIGSAGTNATIGGGTGNQANANRATVCGGAYNTSSGDSSTTSGGGNTASGTSAIAMGNGCVASGMFASIALGQGSTASAITAVAIGGSVIADGNYSTALGQYSQTFGVGGAIAHSSGRVTTTGDVQTRSMTLFTQTTNATPSVLRTTTSAVSSSNILNNRNYTLQAIKGRCIARTPGSTVDYAVWEFTALLNRGADAASSALLVLLVTPALLASGGTGVTWGLSVTADTTNGGLLVTGTGEAGKTITWGCDLNALEVQDLS
jgi:hypothetical protein